MDATTLMETARTQVIGLAGTLGGKTAAYKAIADASGGAVGWQYVKKFACNHPEVANPTVAKLDAILSACRKVAA